MATSVKRALRNGKLIALPSAVRQPNSAAMRHWLENHQEYVLKAVRGHVGRRKNGERFPDAIVRVLSGDADHYAAAAEIGVKPNALKEVLGRVSTELYDLFGKDAASTPAAVLDLLRKTPGQLASIRRLKSAKRKAPTQPNPLAGSVSQFKTAHSGLSAENASLKEQLEQARQGAASGDAGMLDPRATPSAAVSSSNGTARLSFRYEQQEEMDVDDLPGPSNHTARADVKKKILKRIQHDLKGSFGEPAKYVYEATIADGTANAGGILMRMRPKTEPVVCKRFDMPKTDDSLDYLFFELDVMRTHGHHPNIIGCSEVYYSESYVWAIMPYMDAGTITDVITNARLTTGRRLPERIAASYIKQVLNGVEYLHSHGIVHRDLKPENVFVNRRADVKVGDYGWAARSRGRRTVGGTIEYMAPEVVYAWPDNATDEPYTEVVDTWSVGMILYVIVRGALPFTGPNAHTNADPDQAEHDRCERVQADIINTDNLVKRMRRELALLPPELHGFIELMLKADPLTRLTAKQALSHAFLRTPDDNGWRQVVQRAMDNALKADITAFSEAYAAAKLRFRFSDVDAAFTSYGNYYTQAKLLGQRPLSPKEFLREQQRLFTTATGTSMGGGRIEYRGNQLAWRGVLRHKQGKTVAAGYENMFPSHMEITEFAYVSQAAE